MFTIIQKYLIYGLVAVLALTGATVGYYYLRCGQLTNTVSSLTLSLTAATEANVVSQATISALKAERKKFTGICETNLQGYADALEFLRQIDGGNYGQGRKDVLDSNGTIGHGSGDPLRDALNGMLQTPSGGKDGVHQAGGSCNSESAGALPGSVLSSRGPLYCFCSEQHVKNFLKNSVLDRNYEKQLVTILDGLRK